MTYVPEDDSITHINVYSRATTELGRLLTNFARTPFSHPQFGDFMSVEGFWYWLKSGCIHEELRDVYGLQAKKMGKAYSVAPHPTFKETICEAIECKIEQTPRLKELLIASTLPFAHYYVFNGVVVDRTAQQGWQLEAITQLRSVLQKAQQEKRQIL